MTYLPGYHKLSESERIVADELRKNIGFRLLITLAYPPRDYEKALKEAADVFAECVVKALRKKGALR